MKSFQDLSIPDYFTIIYRRIWYVIITACVVFAVAFVYIRRMPSMYKSETTIMVTGRLLPEDYINSLFRESSADRIDFIKQSLQSRAFVERIIQEFNLSGSQGNRDALVGGILANIEVTLVSPNTFKVAYTGRSPQQAQSITRRLSETVMALNQTLRKDKVSKVDRFLDEQLRQAESDLSDAEAKGRQFIRAHFPSLPDDQPVTGESLSVLEKQLATANGDLETVSKQRTFLARRLEEQRQLKVVLENPRAPVPAAETSATPVTEAPLQTEWDKMLVNKRSELQSAVSRYTPQHPDVVRLTREVRELESQAAAERKKLRQSASPSSITAVAGTPSSGLENAGALPQGNKGVDVIQVEMQLELEQLDREMIKQQETRNDLAQKVALYRRRLNLPPELAQQMTDLTREVEAARQRYNSLSSKKVNSELAGSVDTSESNALFTIVDPPNLPRRPVFPDRRTLLSLGLLVALGSGFGAAFAREFLDSTIGDEEEVSRQLNLPVLASIPTVVANGRAQPAPRRPVLAPVAADSEEGATFSLYRADRKVSNVVLDPTTIAAEQYRLARASLSMMQKQNGLKSLLISSTIPNEGKSFVAACMAGILAQETDKSVLLVHADMRTTNGSEVMGLGHREPIVGLSEVLQGSADLEQALLKCTELNLYFLPSGRSVNNPSDLLCLPAFEKLIRDLYHRFDWLVIDSPPVLALADASLIIPVCDAALIVVRAEKTPANLVKDSVQRLGKEHVCGVVLNGARRIKSSHYYKNYYRRIVPMAKR
jgi:polysaccharide biosynthesis transport protein